jgi:hypothetical protein
MEHASVKFLGGFDVDIAADCRSTKTGLCQNANVLLDHVNATMAKNIPNFRCEKPCHCKGTSMTNHAMYTEAATTFMQSNS